jgi:hypothetical protein
VRYGKMRTTQVGVVVHSCNPAVIGNPLDRWLCDPKLSLQCASCRQGFSVRDRGGAVNARQRRDSQSALCHNGKHADLVEEIPDGFQPSRRCNA